jgi:hypothetical protein
LCSSDAGKVDDIMDEIQEEKDIAQQISEAISRPAEEMFEDVSSYYSQDWDGLKLLIAL